MWRHPWNLFGPDEIANERKLGLAKSGHLDDSKSSHFDLTGDGRRRGRHQPAMAVGRDEHLIVGNKEGAVSAPAG